MIQTGQKVSTQQEEVNYETVLTILDMIFVEK